MKMKNGGKESTTTENLTETSSELANALEANEFFLVYQPTIDLQTNAFAGVESLLRWRHRVRGIINPEEFLPSWNEPGKSFP